MQNTSTRPRNWRPSHDNASAEQAASTFTKIEQRTTDSTAAGLTEEALAATEIDPFPSFLDPARAETEVVIACTGAVLVDPPRPAKKTNLAARPPAPATSSSEQPPQANRPPVVPVLRPPPDGSALATRTLPAESRSANGKVEKILGFRLTVGRLALMVGVVVGLSVLGMVVAWMLSSS